MMEYLDLTEKIIGCAYRVYNRMGLDEKCLLLEVKKCGLSFRSQHPIVVRYEGEIVGEFCADILVQDTVIVELKSVRRLSMSHETQLVNYLVSTGKPVDCC